MTSFITFVLCSAPPDFFMPKVPFMALGHSTLRTCDIGAPKTHFGQRCKSSSTRGTGVFAFATCADRPINAIDLFENFAALSFSAAAMATAVVSLRPDPRGDFLVSYDALKPPNHDAPAIEFFSHSLIWPHIQNACDDWGFVGH